MMYFRSIVNELYVLYCNCMLMNKLSWLASSEAVRAGGNSDPVFSFQMNSLDDVIQDQRLWFVHLHRLVSENQVNKSNTGNLTH